MNNDVREQTVYQVTRRILQRIESMRNGSSGRALLANLRRSTGKPLSETIIALPLILEEIPADMLGRSEKASYEERAIITSLQLYATHQQGNSESVIEENSRNYSNFGESLKNLRIGDNTQAVDRRFNAMITASTFNAFVYYLRQLVQLLKAKGKTTKVDYALLANDLFLYQLGHVEGIRLRWARSYYWQQANVAEEQPVTVANTDN